MESETQPRLAAGSERALLGIIRAVSSSLDLETVLATSVRLLTDAAVVRAAFLYLDDGAGSLLLRAAPEPYAGLVGRMRMAHDEGVIGWVFREREPAFLPERMLDDPRAVYVPELDEDTFQSMVAVPLVANDGRAIGVISLHSQAPRQMRPDEVEFLIAAASLVAGAVENADLYATTRRRVGTLEALASLADLIARADSADALLPLVASRAASVLGARACHLLLMEADGVTLRRQAQAPPTAPGPATVRVRHGASPEHVAEAVARAFGASGPPPLVTTLAAGDPPLGALVACGDRAFDDEARELAGSIASQVAVALQKLTLIEGLAERNLIKDVFEDLSRGLASDGLHDRLARVGIDLAQPYVVARAARAHEGAEVSEDDLERFEAALGRAAPGAVCDRRNGSLRALLSARDDIAARVSAAREEAGAPLTCGLSSPCIGLSALATGFEEAAQALAAAPALSQRAGVAAFDELGAYKYLLRVSSEGGVRDRHADALRTLAAYDRQRRSQLVRTLEEYLRQRGNVTATATALYLHPNTLRQRLRRIADLTGIEAREDDWPMLEIALRMQRLEEALGPAPAG